MEIERYELIYKIDKTKTHLRLIGEEFFKRNKMSGHFIYNNKKFRLKEIIETKNLKNDELKIEMIFYKIIYNKSFMFKDCESLLKFSDFNCLKNQDYSQISKIINAPEEEENLFDFFEENKISENTLYQNIEDIESFANFSQISKKTTKRI